MAQPVFTFEDIFKYFPKEKRSTLKPQLSRWIKKGYLKRIKRGLFILPEAKIKDIFSLAPIIYSPSYVSLESALNAYGIIPDIPFVVTSITVKKPKAAKTIFGLFVYQHLKPSLFFGFKIAGEKPFLYKIAYPEKALLDYLYLNRDIIDDPFFPEESRFNLEEINWSRLKKYSAVFKNKKINKTIRILKENNV